MDDVAPLGGDILNLMIESSCDALDVAILVFSRGDHLLYASRNTQKFYPVANEALRQGTSLRDFLEAVYETGVMRALPGTPAKGHSGADEWVSERIADMWHERGEKTERLGRERWFSVATRRTANGIGIMLLEDVSAVKKKEERWREDMERISMTEEILDNMPSPLFVKDRNLSYIAVNKAYCRLHGVSPDNILGRSVWDLVDASMAEHYETEERQVLQTGIPSTQSEEIVTADQRVISIIKNRFRAGKPGYYCVVTLIDDVSDVVEGMRLADADGPAPAARKARVVLSDPPPLAPELPDHISGPMEIAEGDDANEVAGRVLVISSDESFGPALVTALRDFRIDAYQVSEISDAVAILHASQEMDLAVDLVLADEDDWPGIVSDDNIAGIPVLPVSRGRPVHFAVAAAAAAISRLVRMEGAPVGADASYMPDFDEPADQGLSTGYGLEVLVAEDNPINREVYSQILDGLGVNYKIARDGAEAVRLWESLRPPLVLMDTTLPLVDGMEAARRIRAIEGPSRFRTTIVGVLPRTSQEQVDDCLKSGMNVTIVKPLSVEVLEDLYRHHVLENFASTQQVVAG